MEGAVSMSYSPPRSPSFISFRQLFARPARDAAERFVFVAPALHNKGQKVRPARVGCGKNSLYPYLGFIRVVLCDARGNGFQVGGGEEFIQPERLDQVGGRVNGANPPVVRANALAIITAYDAQIGRAHV